MKKNKKHLEVDSEKAEAFAGRLLTALNEGALCLMTSIGPPWRVSIHHLHHALYDRVTGPGRRGTGGDVGRRESASVPSDGWFPFH
jgi:hypothetical protein